MTRGLLLIIVITSPCCAEDIWLGDDSPRYGLDFSTSVGQDDFRAYSFGVALPAFAYSQLDINTSFSEYSDDELEVDQGGESYSLAWQSDPLRSMNYSTTISVADQSQFYESESVSGTVGRALGSSWLISTGLSVERSKVKLEYLNFGLDDVRGESFVREFDSQNIILEIAYQADTWGLGFGVHYAFNDEDSQPQFDSGYVPEDVDELESQWLRNYFDYLVEGFLGRGFTEQESINRASVLYLSLQDQLLERANVWADRYYRLSQWLTQKSYLEVNKIASPLSKYDIDLRLNFNWLNIQWELATQYYESFYSNEGYSNASVYAQYALFENLYINGGLSQSLNDDFTVFDFGLGIVW